MLNILDTMLYKVKFMIRDLDSQIIIAVPTWEAPYPLLHTSS